MNKPLIPKSAKLLLFISTFCAFSLSVFAENWEIPSLTSTLTLHKDGEIYVNEFFNADFTNEMHRGVAREIPTNERYFTFLTAKNEKNEDYDNTVYEQYGNLIIEMRTPDLSYLTGPAVFDLKYKAKGIINFFTEDAAKNLGTFAHEELFWNVNGTNWTVPFDKIKAEVIFPHELDPKLITATCYTGAYGSKEQACKFEIQKDKVVFESTRTLNAYENLSIVVGFPLGTFERALSKNETEINIFEDGTTEIIQTSTINASDFKTYSLSKKISEKIEGQNIRLGKAEILPDETTKFRDSSYSFLGEKNISIIPLENEINDKFTSEVKLKAENLFLIKEDKGFLNLNTTPFEERFPYEKNDIIINFPKPIKAKENFKINCFIASTDYSYESKKCLIDYPTEKQIYISSPRILEAYEEIYFEMEIPKENLYPPSQFKKIFWFIKDHRFSFITPLVFIIMFVLWRLKGRDLGAETLTVVPRWTPAKNLSIAEAGGLYDERFNIKEITATIINFAVTGFIKIKEIKDTNDYELEITKPFQSEYEHERLIFNTIFSTNEVGQTKKISSLNYQFYKKLDSISKDIYESLKKKKLIEKNPKKVRSCFLAIGLFLAILSPVFSIFFLSLELFLSVIFSGIIIVIFSRFMPRKTQEGSKQLFELKGIYNYINTAEKDRLKFFEKDKRMEVFQRLLPYAILFDLSTYWTNKFEGLLSRPPTWLDGDFTNGSRLDISKFSYLLNDFNKSLTRKIVSTPAPKTSSYSRSGGGWSSGGGFSRGGGFSSGGGFSGGGFGGGGGRGL